MKTGNDARLWNAVLDTLQIYFPWDDDLYTHIKDGGLGTEGPEKKALPLIYTDNCESTQGVEKQKRRFVLRPEYFGHELDELGWEESGESSDRIIIPAEKPEVDASLKDGELEFELIPTVDGKEEYHIEYSSRASFGKMYTNWVTLYIPLEDFYDLVQELDEDVELNDGELPRLETETKQNQREEMQYVSLPIDYYCFSLDEFEYARDYLRNNGYGDRIPSLVYDSGNEDHSLKMNPRLKYGVVETKDEDGFWERDEQVVLKIAQPKTTESQRGKDAKAKGAIEFPENRRNRFVVDAQEFMRGSLRLVEYLESS